VQVDQPSGSDVELAISCLRTLLAGWDRYHLDDERVTERTMFVDTGTVSSTDFAITPAMQQQLFVAGQAAASAFLQTGDKTRDLLPVQGAPVRA